MKFRQLVNIANNNVFRNQIAWFGGLDPKSRPFLIQQSIAISLKPIMTSLCFLLFFICEAIKNSNNHLLKIIMSHYIAILSKW